MLYLHCCAVAVAKSLTTLHCPLPLPQWQLQLCRRRALAGTAAKAVTYDVHSRVTKNKAQASGRKETSLGGGGGERTSGHAHLRKQGSNGDVE